MQLAELSAPERQSTPRAIQVVDPLRANDAQP